MGNAMPHRVQLDVFPVQLATALAGADRADADKGACRDPRSPLSTVSTGEPLDLPGILAFWYADQGCTAFVAPAASPSRKGNWGIPSAVTRRAETLELHSRKSCWEVRKRTRQE